ncbi:16S rRNA (uracil(1498)-N(3))-methyltransferase [Acetobacterium carbinolicum]|jgi:16S rRNA (uracil1498-N3)-methyltransferase|uniref:16S rRNA (uracil(1498)-N(3))-methyltransferase n=1 Tax=Acetobacterium TaxID=33951 RepID=UPI000DBEBA53|nr:MULTISPECIES: 16S rRNA (uracil(1498)-N(3))-methyltransferase [unclassified Acetobacterium]AWW26540.1 16S rRNA (uracil(1498)-N(3))-methyltransferase [Acetobacterium sp. KB-1]MDZ5724736.1 16S rRNA (uracil(1498)-N(3))-methyltransferase [Acetobacterium sp. K1/6]
MHRFFVKPEQRFESTITISGEDFKHIAKVLRLGKGDVIEVCDGQGTDYLVTLNTPGEQTISGSIARHYPSQGETPEMSVTLFQGLPKGAKMEVIIQKAVELGVYQIIPFSSCRAVSQIKDKQDKKLERWQRIAYEAAKQSKRGIIPRILWPLTFKEVLSEVARYDLMILAYEDENRQTLKGALEAVRKISKTDKPLSIGVIVGPEGGFDPQEAAACQAAGVISVTLGKRILRTETAGMVVLSQLNFWKEE